MLWKQKNVPLGCSSRRHAQPADGTGSLDGLHGWTCESAFKDSCLAGKFRMVALLETHVYSYHRIKLYHVDELTTSPAKILLPSHVNLPNCNWKCWSGQKLVLKGNSTCGRGLDSSGIRGRTHLPQSKPWNTRDLIWTGQWDVRGISGRVTHPTPEERFMWDRSPQGAAAQSSAAADEAWATGLGRNVLFFHG